MPPPAVRELPAAPGVYRFRDDRGRVLYIGRAVNLRRRVASYWGSGLKGRRHLRRMVGQVATVEAVECDSGHEAAWLERNLLARSKPRFNRTVGGQEVPVHLRLDRSRSSPGVTLVHTVVPAVGVEHFGPYLGGNAVREAARALHRVHPLAWTGSSATASERDMARLRTVGPVDRERLADAISAVLRRDPLAVEATIAELQRIRQVASDRLAFEVAASVHAELRAVKWVVATQRVTRWVDPAAGGIADATADVADSDAIVTGWADGCRVEFRIVSGVIDRWTIRTGTVERVASTPDRWRPFTNRAAALAARLAAAR